MNDRAEHDVALATTFNKSLTKGRRREATNFSHPRGLPQTFSSSKKKTMAKRFKIDSESVEA